MIPLAEQSADLMPPNMILWVLGVIFATIIVAVCWNVVGRWFEAKKPAKAADQDLTITAEEWAEMKRKVDELESLRIEVLALRRWRKAARALCQKAQDNLRKDKPNIDLAVMALDFFMDLEKAHLEGDE